MPGPNTHDDTSADYEQFEKKLLAQDRDAAGVETAAVDDATAQRLVSDLVGADAVTPSRGSNSSSRAERYRVRLDDTIARLAPSLDSRLRRPIRW